ncbi:MAG TPA: D-aminoacylase [Terriglobia bacterium]|jgi:N-acyl-D-aspartate/D-glutamate deacylase|nr:D-aminoacylase [Terriglobia bacterium]
MPSIRIRLSKRIVFALLLAGSVLAWSARRWAQEAVVPSCDLLITHGRILDGSGSPWFSGSIAVKDGKIVDVGRLTGTTARRVIDAAGLAVSPGFIDLHSHSDYTLLVDGTAQSKIRQGVTTEIIGEAASAGPILGPAVADFDNGTAPLTQKDGLQRDWTTLGEYFARAERQGISVNIASYVGSGQVRLDVMGNVNRSAAAAELGEMERLVDQSMRGGAIGVASGLIYAPNMFATTDELVALSRVAARYGGLYTTHIRGEGSNSVPALEEAIAVGERASLPVHILHFKSNGQANWGRMPDLIALIQAARDRGLDVTADQYPYIAGMTSLEQCLPPKYLEGTADDVVARLHDPQARAAIREAIAHGLPGWDNNEVGDCGGWHGVMVASCKLPEDKKYEGRRMDEVARLMNKDPVDALCDLLIAEHATPMAIYFSMSEADVESAMKQPWVGIGSDGAAVSPAMTFMGRPHPRFYGTFPRVLGVYVREKHVLTLPDAVRKMTSLSASIVGLTDRGLLRPGMAADLVIFDPATVKDRATFEDPAEYPAGIPYVIVNGTVVIDKGEHTGAKPGKVLYGRGREQ